MKFIEISTEVTIMSAFLSFISKSRFFEKRRFRANNVKNHQNYKKLYFIISFIKKQKDLIKIIVKAKIQVRKYDFKNECMF